MVARGEAVGGEEAERLEAARRGNGGTAVVTGTEPAAHLPAASADGPPAGGANNDDGELADRRR
jgi:hypothetical protein